MKDTILNKIIRFCLRRCNMDAATRRMFIHKMSKGEIEMYLEEYDKVEEYWKNGGWDPFKKLLTKIK